MHSFDSFKEQFHDLVPRLTSLKWHLDSFNTDLIKNLFECTDILPAPYYQLLEMPQDSTYGEAARNLHLIQQRKETYHRLYESSTSGKKYFDIVLHNQTILIPAGLEQVYIRYLAALHRKDYPRATTSWFDLNAANDWHCEQSLSKFELNKIVTHMKSIASPRQVQQAIDLWEDYEIKLSNPLFAQILPAEQWLRSVDFNLSPDVLEMLAIYRLNPLIKEHLYAIIADAVHIKGSHLDEQIDIYLSTVGNLHLPWGELKAKVTPPLTAVVDGLMYQGTVSLVQPGRKKFSFRPRLG